jgi:MFS family permease
MFLRHKSYEVLPALSIRRQELRRSLRLITAAWGFGIIWSTCISGSWMNSFQQILGFNDFHFGLMQAVPFLGAIGNVAATILIERSGLRKWQFIVCSGASRVLWLGMGLIVLLIPGTHVAVWMVLLVRLASDLLAALGMPAWYTWMGDLIPRRIRGRFLGRRGQLTRLVQFPVAIALAILMDWAIRTDRPFLPAQQPVFLWCLAGMFAVAAVFGLLDILLFARIREVTPTTPDKPRRPAVIINVPPPAGTGIFQGAAFAMNYAVAAGKEVLFDPLKDFAFRRYVLYGAVINFAMAVGGPFYMRDMRENLGISHIALNITFMVLGPILAIVAMAFWGDMVDRWGRRPTLMVSTTVAIFGAVPYFFASRSTPSPAFMADGLNAAAGWLGRMLGDLWGLMGSHVDWSGWQPIPPGAPMGAWLICSITIFFGFTGWAGVMIAQQGIILGFADGAGRSKYVSAYAALTSLGGFAGGVVGGLLANWLAAAPWFHPIHIGKYLEWNQWHATFAVSILARIAGLWLLMGMPDPGAQRARDMFRSFGAGMYQLVTDMFFYNWRDYIRRGKKK